MRIVLYKYGYILYWSLTRTVKTSAVCYTRPVLHLRDHRVSQWTLNLPVYQDNFHTSPPTTWICSFLPGLMCISPLIFFFSSLLVSLEAAPVVSYLKFGKVSFKESKLRKRKKKQFYFIEIWHILIMQVLKNNHCSAYLFSFFENKMSR